MQQPINPSLSPANTRIALCVILALYLVLGGLYAVGTPIWQVPDEPAHYNYVEYVAHNLALPELREGDFPSDYLEIAKMYRFVGFDMSRFRYESHQPPLYYILAAAVFRLADALRLNVVLAIRFFSVLLGAVAILLGYRLVRVVYPEEPILALGTAALAAVLPMHLTLTAAVNNDVLAELVLALSVGQLIAWGPGPWRPGRAAGMGALLGLAVLTKAQSFVAVGVALFALAYDFVAARRAGAPWPWRRALGCGALMLGVALLVALPWLLRNASLYGPTDLLGMARHDQVAAGQLTTRDALARDGAAALLQSFVFTTFQSFWAQFGWMGVILHPRYYYAAVALSVLVAVGLAAYLWRVLRGSRAPQAPHLPDVTRRGLLLLGMWGGLTLAGYLWYNTKFVQHQGRYLFPAIVPMGLAFALGLRELLRGAQRLPLAVVGLGILALLADGLRAGSLKVFTTAMVASGGVGLVGGKRLERAVPGLAMALVYLAIAGFAVFCLYGYVIPQLAP